MISLSQSRAGRLALALFWLACAMPACALLGKGKPLQVRHFDLEADPAYQPPVQAPTLRLRLGKVEAARHIERRFVSRLSPHELEYYEEWRWTDEPDAFLERILNRNLFERAAITRVVSGAAPTLDVELIAFEELKQKKRVQVAVLAAMRDDRVQLWQRTFQAEYALGTHEPAVALADALSKALAQVAADLTAQTLSSLASAAPAPPQAAPLGPAASPAP